MAIFKCVEKMGKHELPLAISKQRRQRILRKLDIIKDGKGRKEFEKDAMGEMQTIRTIVGKSEGFQHPVNFKVRFGMPLGIDQRTLEVTQEGPEEYDDLFSVWIEHGQPQDESGEAWNIFLSSVELNGWRNKNKY